ncbi:hypothetical protein LEP1GSC049_1133 [Leptospira kirschneri serovar Cynopteri str. 3522 CT]|uniref:Uncharacterized protein n=1 Tax=Leptospira kirschneri str. 200802841 TaxID=1193047 RepID=A0A828Y6B9_9LEPT|nr:hypothetical protein LEP1GSC131_2663 [Leptospira kirschneri str. 200802841]EKR08331.1 hypothetical protein LEP1GSC122_3772 [Leptospira kirschneri serovar Valbuzzi str. 200702274]EMK12003.1 hypothetical protein LEP1GSC042_1779 [Leptospira kirschneri serovar Bim str. PUO 1247]EMN04025.1 hypothetical protein LEP1GSC046_0633 [Leptospira kirschneri serovar Bim str. 1051]EMO81461.1 hypothetical protein LEP1GSC126_0626 [Leptospira kirschneri str. 200801774]EPG49619.1 hypothetical protein LEP1GSC04
METISIVRVIFLVFFTELILFLISLGVAKANLYLSAFLKILLRS